MIVTVVLKKNKIIMKRINHTIRRKKIPEVKLVSLTGKTWYDSNDTPIPWTGATDFLVTGFTPDTGFLVFNVIGGDVTSGYYKWNTPSENTWNLITSITGTTPEQIKKEINQQIYDDFQLPLFLEATADEMGDMVDFDKNIGHNKISANFTYESVCTESGSTLTINNTTTYQLVNIILANDTNPDGSMNVTSVKRLATQTETEPSEKIKDETLPYGNFIIIDGEDFSISGSSFTVHWGDETTSPIGINDSVTKSFDVAEERTIRIVFESPYLTNQVVKVVNCGESTVSDMNLSTQDDRIIKTENNNSINVS
jgi:hypothetical protein